MRVAECPVFVGRDRELTALRTALAAMRSGTPCTVLIEGPAGIGKTALVEQFLAAVQEPRVVRASGERWEALVPYGVIDQLLRSAGVSGSWLLATRERALPPEEPVNVGAYLLDVLGALEQKSPLIVVIEDVHWTDTDSLRVLLFVLRRLVSERVLTLLTLRDDDAERPREELRRLAHEPTGLTVRLPGLTASEVQRLGTELGVPDFSARAARRLHAHTRGNPLFVRELLTELPADRWRTWEPHLPAPHAVAVQVERKLDACASGTRRLVEAASALGTTAPLSATATLAGVEDPLPALDEAVVAGLLQVRDEPGVRDVVFPHPLVQAAVYEQLGPARRVRLHRVAAELVDGDGAPLRHRVAAADPPDDGLAGELSEFAERQAATGAWAGAASAFVEASRMSTTRQQREQRLMRALDAMISAGDLVQASVFAREIAGFAPGPYRDAALGYLAILSGKPGDAEALLHGAWQQGAAGDDQRIAAVTAQRWALHSVGRLRGGEVVDWARRAIELAPPGDAARVEADAVLGLGLAWSGRLCEGIAAYESFIVRARGEVMENVTAGSVRMPLGWLRLVADDVPRAGSLLAGAVQNQLPLGSTHLAVWAYVWLARAQFLEGSWDESALAAARAVALLEETRHEWLRPLTRWAAVAVPAARGDWRVAEEHARLGSAQGGDYELMVVAAGLARAQLAAARGDHEAVLRALEPVLEIRPRDGVDEPGFFPWQGLYGDALVSAGRLAEAEAFLEPHEQLAAARERRSSIAVLARVRGRLESAAGRAEAAEAAFRRGLAQLAGLAMPFAQGLLELAHGQVLRRHGHRRAAAEQLQAARDRFTELGARPYVERCERELGACGLAPAKRHDFDPSRLTAQELAVAQLVARGLSNRQVASELFVSVKTVQFHLTRIYSKLRVSSRTELAAHFRQEAAADGQGERSH